MNKRQISFKDLEVGKEFLHKDCIFKKNGETTAVMKGSRNSQEFKPSTPVGVVVAKYGPPETTEPEPEEKGDGDEQI